MSDQEFDALTQRIEKGEKLTILEQFLYDREKSWRDAEPNALQRLLAAHYGDPMKAGEPHAMHRQK